MSTTIHLSATMSQKHPEPSKLYRGVTYGATSFESKSLSTVESELRSKGKAFSYSEKERLENLAPDEYVKCFIRSPRVMINGPFGSGKIRYGMPICECVIKSL